MQEPVLLSRNDAWLVVSKPSGWLTIPGREPSDTPVLSAWAEEQHGHVWVVHRLDRETSGVVLLARSAESHRQANTWFQKHQVRKVYHCLAAGQPGLPTFRIQKPIESAPCVTQVEVKERAEAGFLAQVMPLTGRRHQIRIHLAGEGFPLWGDPRYGGPREIALAKPGARLPVGRVALHAARLALPSGEFFEAPWPEDFAAWVQELREVSSVGG